MTHSFVHLERDGVALLLDARGPGLPVVLHWGRALGDLADADLPAVLAIC